MSRMTDWMKLRQKESIQFITHYSVNATKYLRTVCRPLCLCIPIPRVNLYCNLCTWHPESQNWSVVHTTYWLLWASRSISCHDFVGRLGINVRNFWGLDRLQYELSTLHNKLGANILRTEWVRYVLLGWWVRYCTTWHYLFSQKKSEKNIDATITSVSGS